MCTPDGVINAVVPMLAGEMQMALRYTQRRSLASTRAAAPLCVPLSASAASSSAGAGLPACQQLDMHRVQTAV